VRSRLRVAALGLAGLLYVWFAAVRGAGHVKARKASRREAWMAQPLQLLVVEGDITELDVDAIANAANDHLWMGAGVAGAIKRAGGEEIEREAVARGPIALGTAVATSGGRLRARWVVHGAVMGQDLQTSADLIGQTTRSCLAVAEELGARSLALPAFGTGVGGFPLAECARIMVDGVRSYAPATLERVVFAVYGPIAEAAFRGAVGAGR
jgi:O-acetyl-ADP-ribose deacetylase (regulator of RNase III)